MTTRTGPHSLARMSAPTPRRRWTVVQLLLAVSLLGSVLLIGTEAGRLLTALRAVGGLIGAALIVSYVVRAPRDHDHVDILVLAGLLLFLVTCITSSIPRLSFEAATTALAYAGAFFVVRGAVTDSRGRDLAVVVLGGLGSLLGVMFLINWGAVWIEWISIVGAVPPLDSALPSAPYAGIHVAILAGLLLPATVLLARRPWLWPVGMVGTASLLAVMVMSGSRSAWLGLLLGGIALAVMGAGRMVVRLRKPVLAAGGVVAVAGLGVLGPQLAARIATGSTVELRLAMWGESIERWLQAPVFGYGPGTFAAQFNFTDYYNRFEPWHTHPHNTVVQILVESGLVGLLGAGLVLTAFVVGVRRHGKIEWAPMAAVVFMAGVGLTENPIISAYLVAPLIVWAAMAAPRSSRNPVLVRGWSLRLVNLALAAVVGLAVTSTLVASWAHDRAAISSGGEDDDKVTSSLRQAIAFDPAMPLYRRELGTWLMASGDLAEATEQVRRALALNPADAATLRTWALLRLAAGDEAQALATASEAHRRADLHPENALTLAYVAAAAGDEPAELGALVRAVRRYPWLLAAPEWDGLFPDVDKEALLGAARDSWSDEAEFSHRNLQARVWLEAIAGEPADAGSGVAVVAETALLQCQPDVAVTALGELTGRQAADSEALQARLMLGRAFGGAVDETELLTLLGTHNPALLREASDGVAGVPAAGDHNADVATYARIPIRPPIGPVLPTPSSGLSAWLRDPVTAAVAGAPGSGLAMCR